MAAKKVDIEVILDEIKSALQAKFNSKLDEIQAEKSAGDLAAGRIVAVQHVDANAYVMQSMNDSVINYDPFILCRLDDPGAVGIGPATAKNYKITVALCCSDTGQDKEIFRRLYRYSRALEETFEAYFAGITSGFKLSIESLAPIQFALANSSNDYKAVGVSITVGIA